MNFWPVKKDANLDENMLCKGDKMNFRIAITFPS